MKLEAFREVKPLPFTDIVPEVILEAFNEVNCEPLPTKLVADNVLFVLFHVKFGDCKIDVAAFPINIWLLDNVVVPNPPRVIANVPDDTLEAFKFVNESPEPEKVEPEKFVADIVVPVKVPANVPPVKGKNNDNVEDKGVPFLYISAQLILFNTSKA